MKDFPPGPAGRPLVGVLPELRANPVTFMYACHNKFGPIVRLPFPGRDVISVAAPDLAESVLVNNATRFRKIERRPGKPFGLQLFAGNGLISVRDQEVWLTQRRMIQPLFHRKVISAMTEQIVESGLEMLQRWNTFPNGTTIALEHEMKNVMLNVIIRTMFGSTAPALSQKIGRAANDAIRFVMSHETNLIQLPLGFPGRARRNFRRSLKTLDDIIYGLITERRASGVLRNDLLDMLLTSRDQDSGNSMSARQIRDEAASILIAGYETSALMLTWAWHCLNQNPGALATLQSEVDEVLKGQPPTFGHISDLRYTRAVLDESLRLYPPLPTLPRVAIKNVKLGEYTIPAGTILLVSVYSLHHNAEIWDNPSEFDPNRFHSNSQNPIPQHAYVPFGAGPRLCIGNQFALLEGTILLAMMANYANLVQVMPGKIGWTTDVAIRPAGGLQVALQRR